jgi:hypothetical protein
METNHDESILLKIQQVLANEYFKIDIRKEGDNFNIYTQKGRNSNFEYQLGIPIISINEVLLKKILTSKEHSLFISSLLKQVK